MKDNTFLMCVKGNLNLQVFNKITKNITMQIKLPDVDPGESMGYFLSLKPIELSESTTEEGYEQKYFLVRDEFRLIYLQIVDKGVEALTLANFNCDQEVSSECLVVQAYPQQRQIKAYSVKHQSRGKLFKKERRKIYDFTIPYII